MKLSFKRETKAVTPQVVLIRNIKNTLTFSTCT